MKISCKRHKNIAYYLLQSLYITAAQIFARLKLGHKFHKFDREQKGVKE